MNDQVAKCNLCKDKEPFTVPWSNTPADNVSAAIMKEHLASEHGVNI
jgi:hypothetical protein